MGTKRGLIVLVVVMLMLGACVPAFADVFGDRQTDIFQVAAPQQKLSDAIEATDVKPGIAVDTDTILGVIGKAATKLGTTEGAAYGVRNEKGYNYASATVGTFDRIHTSIGVGLLSAAGAGIDVNYNLGEVLPEIKFPIIKYISRLKVGVGGGWLPHEDKELDVLGTIQLKTTF